MPETREELESQLLSHQQEKERNENAILETRKLLDRVDKKRKENPEERHKWNAKLDNLENVLSEKKRLLTSSETHIQQIQRKLEMGLYEGDGSKLSEKPAPEPTKSPEPVAGQPLPDHLTLEDLRAAVGRVLATHMVQLQTVADLDHRMAKAFIGSRAADQLSKDDTAELKKRLRILDKTRGNIQVSYTPSKRELATEPDLKADVPNEQEAVTPPPARAPESNRQELLKCAISKCNDQNYDTITLQEIEVLSKYVRALTLKNSDPEGAKILQASLDEIQNRLRGAGLS